ncbi:MAG: hypothetical protein R3344_14665, partial [Acidobacteriota bacterium]|nr:hypothetical protein [Acidobacteriota bacterium]
MKVAAFGSFPRVGEGPENQRLRRGIQQWQAGKIGDADLRSIQEDVTREAIAIQEKAGVDWPTDGLIRWEDGQTYFADRLEGFHRGGLLRYFDTNTYYRQPEIDGDIRWTKPITVAVFEFARAQTDRHLRPIVTGPFTLAGLSLDTHYDDPKRVVDLLPLFMHATRAEVIPGVIAF